MNSSQVDRFALHSIILNFTLAKLDTSVFNTSKVATNLTFNSTTTISIEPDSIVQGDGSVYSGRVMASYRGLDLLMLADKMAMPLLFQGY